MLSTNMILYYMNSKSQQNRAYLWITVSFSRLQTLGPHDQESYTVQTENKHYKPIVKKTLVNALRLDK
jgi:hypothetical protein